MTPSTLSYSSATLTNVKEHMCQVDDWISNLYPDGYSFSHFKSNFTSTIDIEFGIKANDFEGCKTEQDMKDEIENIMEVKYPIHTCRMEGIKPTLRSNEEAMKKQVVSLNAPIWILITPRWPSATGRNS